jgi:hypothetical protein
MQRLEDAISHGYNNPRIGNMMVNHTSFGLDAHIERYYQVGGSDKHYEMNIHGDNYYVLIRSFRDKILSGSSMSLLLWPQRVDMK